MLNEKSLKNAHLLKPDDKSFTRSCVENGLFAEYTNMLEKLTNEFKRENVGEREDEESDESEDEELVVLTAAEVTTEKVRVAKIVKKGVGYNFSGGTNWNIDGYLKNKLEKNQQIIKILETMTALIKVC